jgi:uncharacterized SAM-binding protein YcdF (DUF218 family)
MTPRLLGGFVAMPFVAALVGLAFTLARATTLRTQFQLEASIVLGALFFVTGLIIVCLVAGPLYFWWTKRHQASLVALAAWGALLGNIPTAIGILLFVSNRLWRGENMEGLARFSFLSAVGTTTGLICGVVFWLIAAPGRGDAEPARTPFEV